MPRMFPSGPEINQRYLFYEYSADRLVEKFYESLMVYYDRDMWRKLQRNGMRQDFSWERAAHNYVNAYQKIIAARLSRGW